MKPDYSITINPAVEKYKERAAEDRRERTEEDRHREWIRRKLELVRDARALGDDLGETWDE